MDQLTKIGIISRYGKPQLYTEYLSQLDAMMSTRLKMEHKSQALCQFYYPIELYEEVLILIYLLYLVVLSLNHKSGWAFVILPHTLNLNEWRGGKTSGEKQQHRRVFIRRYDEFVLHDNKMKRPGERQPKLSAIFSVNMSR